MAVQIVVIGASLGGFQAVGSLLAALDASFTVPLVIAQHRAPQSGEPLRQALQKKTALRVREPVDKEQALPGRAYLAPADYHLLVDRDGFALSTEGPVNAARPSIDVLFESAGDSYGAGVLAVILTGASADGARGCAHVKHCGGQVIVQEPETAESATMPRAAIRAAKVDFVTPLEQIPALLQRLTLSPHG